MVTIPELLMQRCDLAATRATDRSLIEVNPSPDGSEKLARYGALKNVRPSAQANTSSGIAVVIIDDEKIWS